MSNYQTTIFWQKKLCKGIGQKKDVGGILKQLKCADPLQIPS